METLEVHFDYVLIGDDVEVGALLLDDGDVLESSLKTYEGIRYHARSNNYQFSILAWRLAADLVVQYAMAEGYDYDQVVFCNQNELMFKWFRERKVPEAYIKNMSILSERFAVMSDFGIEDIAIRLIKGSDNQAKKTLKKRKSKKTGEVTNKIDLSNLDMKPVKEEKDSGYRNYGKKKNDIRSYGGDVNLRDKVESSRMSSNVVSMENWDRKKA